MWRCVCVCPHHPPTPGQITVKNPSTECGRVATSLAAGPLPSGWTLRTCVPIVVAISMGADCATSLATDTTWRLTVLADKSTVLQGTAVAGASTTYCGPVDQVLQFALADTRGE
jgi:hypothetical protein